MSPHRQPVLVLLLLVPLPLRAGSSANYTLDPEIVDSGGRRAGSVSYTANFSAAPGGAGASTAYALRSGFAGALADTATGSVLHITASPSSVSEGAASQLSAALLYDDFTRVLLPPGSVVWSVQSGPLPGISASGLATAAVVYQDSPAVARGTWQTRSGTATLTVINTNTDNFGSYAADSIHDDWQVLDFGTGNPKAAPDIDADGDGYDNLFEYRASLSPVDPLSVFSFHVTTLPDGGHSVTLSPRFPSSSYTLLGSNDLSLWSPVAGTVTDNGIARNILDPVGAGPRRFYSISIQRP
jgi:hypothetical protein